MRQQQIRQGDVFLRPTTDRPSAQARKVTDKGRVILAYGEVTGHAHEVIGVSTGVDNADPVPAMELFQEPDGRRLLVVNRASEMRHEEHGKIAIPAGGYEVVQQREYTPEAIRNVQD